MLKRFFSYIKKWKGQHYLYLFTAIAVPGGFSFIIFKEFGGEINYIWLPILFTGLFVVLAIWAINSELE